MMDYQDQLKLQSYLDGELSEAEAQQIADRLTADPEAAALLTELRQTGLALAEFEHGILLPETREFYWSKIQRGLQRPEAVTEPAPRVPWAFRLRQFLMPATGIAVVALLTMVVIRENPGTAPESSSSAETALEDSGAFTYHDYSKGVTLVWLSYPADNEGADPDDTDSLD